MSLKIFSHSVLVALASVIIWACPQAQAASSMSIKASTDSATLVMGDRVTVNVEVVKGQHPGTIVDMPQKKHDYYGLEMIEWACDSTDLGNGRTQLNYHIIFQAFDPMELLTLPPFRYAAEGDTVSSDILTFKVYPVDLSPELGDVNNPDSLTIHPSELPQTLPARWYDFVPDWWIWVVIGILVIALAYVVWMLYKKNGPAIFTPKKPISPYDLAVQRLASLKDRRLLEQGQTKTYYTDLIDIMRSYLDGRFGINAMEMTSTQILRKLRENKETHLSAAQMEQVLQLADIVKFAAANPTAEEGQRTFNTIAQFLESTKPEPEPEADAKDAANVKQKNEDRTPKIQK